MALLFMGLPAVMHAETKEYLVVHLNNGGSVNYVLEQTPTVTFTPASLHVESATLSDDHTLSEVSHFTFEDLDLSALPCLTANDSRITVTDSQVKLEGFTPGASVNLADAQGIVYAGGVVDGNGTVILDISRVPNGVYIISTTDNKSFKIFKK